MTKDKVRSTKEALNIALKALELVNTSPHLEDWNHAFDDEITAIKEALAQQNEFKPDWDEKLALTKEVIRLSKRIEELEAQTEQERFLVATIGNWGRVEWTDGVFPSIGDKMYSAPPKWVGLTDTEVKKIVGSDRYTDLLLEVVKIVEAKLKEKNT